MNPVAHLGRLFSLVLGKKAGTEGSETETEIERKLREALRDRAKRQGLIPYSPSTPSPHENKFPPQEGTGIGTGSGSGGESSTGAGGGEVKTGCAPRKGTHFFSLNTIALKFPKVDAAFRQIRQKFDQYDKDHSQSIDVEELRECLKELQVSVTEQEMLLLFREADMDSSDGVQFKEFILLLAMVHLLTDTHGGARFGLPEVEAAFDMVEDAFLFFDEDKDGFLTRLEVTHALTSGKEGFAGASAAQRFTEMDYNTDGLCSFKEFLYAYVGWVGTADDEDEDEDEEDEKAPAPQEDKPVSAPSATEAEEGKDASH